MNRSNTSLFIILIFIISSTNSCYYDNEEELYPNINCDTSTTTYSAAINPIIITNCALSGCHVPGSSVNHDFTNFAELKALADNGKLQNRVIDLKNMPPSGPLSNCDILKLQLWINNGAQNN